MKHVRAFDKKNNMDEDSNIKLKKKCSPYRVMETGRELSWYVPKAMYYFFTFEFIEFLPREFSEYKYKKGEEHGTIEENDDTVWKVPKIVGRVIKIALQVVFFLIFAFEVLLQFILFITDSVNLNARCCNNSTSGEDTFQEVLFATDFINSLVALGCCYFIYVNSNILDEVEFKYGVTSNLTKSNPKIQIDSSSSNSDSEDGEASRWKCPFPSGKSKFFSGTGLFLAYMIVFILPLILIFYFKPEYNPSYRELNYKYYLGTVNTFIDIFPDILEKSGCNVSKTMNLKTLRYVDSILECIITVQWHLSPVLACIAIRYICKNLQYKTEQAVKNSKEYIEKKWQEMREMGNDIQVADKIKEAENANQKVGGEIQKVGGEIQNVGGKIQNVAVKIEKVVAVKIEKVVAVKNEKVGGKIEKVGGEIQKVGGEIEKVWNQIQKVEGADQKVEGADQKVEGADQKVEGADQKVEGADQKVEDADQKVEDADQKVEGADQKVEDADQKVEGADQKVEDADQKVWNQIQKVGGKIEKVGGEIEKVGGEIKKVGGEIKKVGGEIKKVGNKIQKVGNEIQKVGNEIQKVGVQTR